MYAAPMKALASIPAVKLRRRKYSSGSSGAATRLSTRTKATSPTTPVTNAAQIDGESRPTLATPPQREHQTRHASGQRHRTGDVETHLLAGRLSQHQAGRDESHNREAGLQDEDDAPAEQIDERPAADQP